MTTTPAPAYAPAGGPAVTTWSWHEGSFMSTAEARVPLTTQALQYGTGVFEGIRAYVLPGGRELAVFRLDDHYRRFLRSCRLLRIDLPYDADDLARATVELLRRNATAADTYIRPLGYKLSMLAGTRPGVGLAGVSDAVSVSTFLMGHYAPPGGLRCAVSSWRRPADGVLPVRAKVCGGYVNSALALDEARAAGLDDAILCNERGQVAEATTANVFAVSGNRLVTPAATADILEGITRDTVRELAGDIGLACEVRDVQRSELLVADEVFLTGTGLGIAPVVELAGRPIGDGTPGPVTRLLSERYTALVRGELDDDRGWLTRVPLNPAPAPHLTEETL
ncbi:MULTISPECIES: branched-chain amino acid transaminase [Streptomyces]|uniref:Branched-chain-amino-acid aminotransferase n=1 Tax=Streptomyces heilongjiangensis TaxID=945052 RepID=A0ABW1B1J5_9ACTN|nr:MULTISPECIES: branched-chain amino acid transaminase [Streptomyces]MDC2945628.1 branched-chain amino acid transaminase [Streptomyces heilongjiangensis]